MYQSVEGSFKFLLQYSWCINLHKKLIQTFAKEQQFLATAGINIFYTLRIAANAISRQCISVMFTDLFYFLKLIAQNQGFPKTNINVSRFQDI